MNISQDGIDVTRRIFEAIDFLRSTKRIRGLQTFTRRYGLNYWNMNTLKKQPGIRVLKPEYLAYLVRDYGFSADWLLAGNGRREKEKPAKNLQIQKSNPISFCISN